MGEVTKMVGNIFKKREDIPKPTTIELWCKAGGRCELCNEKLWRDGLTYHKINQSNIAHIIAQTPNGPRGSVEDSKRLAKDISNLMLVCAKHNHLFDNNEISKEYNIERLRQMKSEHEARIDIATSIVPEKQTTPLIYTSLINDTRMNISDTEIRNAVFPEFYPILDKTINLQLETNDTEKNFWDTEKSNLTKFFERKIRPELEDGSIKHLSVFGFAPQPLLIYFGYLLGDKFPAEIYPLQRNPREWKWTNVGCNDLEYIISKPEETQYPPVLTISLSAKIDEDRIKNSLKNEPYSHWDISIKSPDREFLTNKNYLYRFSREISILLDDIKNKHGINTELKVIPVMPLATAIEFGRRIDPKSSMPIKLYNNNQNSGIFEPVIDICLPNKD